MMLFSQILDIAGEAKNRPRQHHKFDFNLNFSLSFTEVISSGSIFPNDSSLRPSFFTSQSVHLDFGDPKTDP